MTNKKGLSEVVATITLVFLSIVAVGILAGYVVNMINHNINAEKRCRDYKEYFKFTDEFEFNCKKVQDLGTGLKNYYAFTITVDGSKEEAISSKIKGFDVIFAKDSESKLVTVLDGANPVTAASGEVGMMNLVSTPTRPVTPLKIPKPGEAKTYVYNAGADEFKSITVIPRLEDGTCSDQPSTVNVLNEICDTAI